MDQDAVVALLSSPPGASVGGGHLCVGCGRAVPAGAHVYTIELLPGGRYAMEYVNRCAHADHDGGAWCSECYTVVRGPDGDTGLACARCAHVHWGTPADNADFEYCRLGPGGSVATTAFPAFHAARDADNTPLSEVLARMAR